MQLEHVLLALSLVGLLVISVAVAATLIAERKSKRTAATAAQHPASNRSTDEMIRLASLIEGLAGEVRKMDHDTQQQVNAIVSAINADREEISRHRNLLGMFGDRFLVIERELMLLKGTLGSLHKPMTGAVPASLNNQFQQPATVPPPQPLPPAPVMTAQEMFARAVELEKAEMDKLDQAKTVTE